MEGEKKTRRHHMKTTTKTKTTVLFHLLHTIFLFSPPLVPFGTGWLPFLLTASFVLHLLPPLSFLSF